LSAVEGAVQQKLQEEKFFGEMQFCATVARAKKHQKREGNTIQGNFFLGEFLAREFDFSFAN